MAGRFGSQIQPFGKSSYFDQESYMQDFSWQCNFYARSFGQWKKNKPIYHKFSRLRNIGQGISYHILWMKTLITQKTPGQARLYAKLFQAKKTLYQNSSRQRNLYSGFWNSYAIWMKILVCQNYQTDYFRSKTWCPRPTAAIYALSSQ